MLKFEGEIQKLKETYDRIFSEYKNEKFERKNLDVNYKQALTVMEEEQNHIKKLNIHISELN
jgi:hypothetical protein